MEKQKAESGLAWGCNVCLTQKQEQALEIVRKLNSVKDFNVETFIKREANVNTGEIELIIPYKILLTWFKLKYPDSAIQQDAELKTAWAEAKCTIYRNYLDEKPIAVAKAIRTKAQYQRMCANANDLPTEVSGASDSYGFYEWAQTAATARALVLAGFGLLPDFIMDYDKKASEGKEQKAEEDTEKKARKKKTDQQVRTEEKTENDSESTHEQKINFENSDEQEKSPETDDEQMEMTLEEANAVVLMTKQYPNGISLGELNQKSQKLIDWLAANKEGCSEKIYNAAQIIQRANKEVREKAS